MCYRIYICGTIVYMEPIILTFPRCGANYLHELLFQSSGVRIPRTHVIQEALSKFSISIIRKPEDSFISQVAMDMHYGLTAPLSPLSHNYIEMYEYLINNKSLLVKYEDLINNPELVTMKVCNYIGYNFKESVYKDYLLDEVWNNHLVSSKKSKYYSEIKIPEKYLIEPNKVYLEALNHCISI